jgi:hypothetical protein
MSKYQHPPPLLFPSSSSDLRCIVFYGTAYTSFLAWESAKSAIRMLEGKQSEACPLRCEALVCPPMPVSNSVLAPLLI